MGKKRDLGKKTSRFTAEMISEPDNFFIIVRDKKEMLDIELLLLARKIPFFLHAFNSLWKFSIPPAYAVCVSRELSLFQEENVQWPPHTIFEANKKSVFSWIHGVVVFFLFSFHLMSIRSGVYPDLISQGKFSAHKVLSGEWERVITALTLHANDLHLFGNIALLWFFVYGVSQYVGIGQAWLLILLAGGLGNGLNAFFFQQGHPSIGASTAVFGSLGIMGGLHFRLGINSNRPFRYRIIPIFAAICLLALLGSHRDTDIMAHLFGFIAGIGIGLASKMLTKKNIAEDRFIQIAAFICFWGILMETWMAQLYANNIH